MIEHWGLTNQDIGLAFSAYGFTAMISYFFGGPLADKFAPHKLISLSLLLTTFGGLALIIPPTAMSFTLIYAFFGVSTILFMWGAMIKLTHILGGESARARAMGVLDAGRGLMAALMSTLLVFLVANLGAQSSSLSKVYLTVSSFTALLAFAVWFGLNEENKESSTREPWSLEKSKELLSRLDIWLLSSVILAAYCGYKSVDNYALYLVQVKGFTLQESSQFTSYFFWMRPVGALVIGFLADWLAQQFKGSRFALLAFLLLIAALSQFALYLASDWTLFWAMSVLSTSALMAYGLRAVYFAVFGDMTIPAHLIGTAVGFVSVIGFLPDLFFGALTGYLIDQNPGAKGFEYSFLFTSLMLTLGSLAALMNYRRRLR